MTQITIEPFSITTTKIGFGCSSLVGVIRPKEAQILVDAAYDEGIRHFDVARSYGQGTAESVLAQALGARRPNVTITSKFGLTVPARGLLVGVARTLLRPVANSFRRRQARSKPVAWPEGQKLDFSRRNAELSLETTLRELRTDYLDILLLHEARAEALTDSGLIDFLEDSRHKGRIRAYGVGTHLRNLQKLVVDRPEYCPIVQHEWSALMSDIAIPPLSFRIIHGTLAESFVRLQSAFRKDPKLARSTTEASGLDVTVPENLSALLLRSAALKYPNSITLFSARSRRRIHQNTLALADSGLDGRCVEFVKSLRQ